MIADNSSFKRPFRHESRRQFLIRKGRGFSGKLFEVKKNGEREGEKSSRGTGGALDSILRESSIQKRIQHTPPKLAACKYERGTPEEKLMCGSEGKWDTSKGTRATRQHSKGSAR